jgi:hypothetical protein
MSAVDPSTANTQPEVSTEGQEVFGEHFSQLLGGQRFGRSSFDLEMIQRSFRSPKPAFWFKEGCGSTRGSETGIGARNGQGNGLKADTKSQDGGLGRESESGGELSSGPLELQREGQRKTSWKRKRKQLSGTVSLWTEAAGRFVRTLGSVQPEEKKGKRLRPRRFKDAHVNSRLKQSLWSGSGSRCAERVRSRRSVPVHSIALWGHSSYTRQSAPTGG